MRRADALLVLVGLVSLHGSAPAQDPGRPPPGRAAEEPPAYTVRIVNRSGRDLRIKSFGYWYKATYRGDYDKGQKKTVRNFTGGERAFAAWDLEGKALWAVGKLTVRGDGTVVVTADGKFLFEPGTRKP